VPHNYIEVPPENIQDVKSNYHIIKGILNQNDEQNRKKVKGLLNELKQTIYPVIDKFISGSLIVLTDHFGWPNGHSCVHKLEDLDGILDRIMVEKQRKEYGQDENLLNNKWIEGFIRDMKYLQRMQELENEPSTKVHDIVPISGLTVSRFVRLENELKTVLELWDHKHDLLPFQQ